MSFEEIVYGWTDQCTDARMNTHTTDGGQNVNTKAHLVKKTVWYSITTIFLIPQSSVLL